MCCEFQNDLGDRFCGGCGASVSVEVPRIGGRSIPVISREELTELLALPDVAPQQLPSTAIAQDDLDRLFGGSS